MCKGDVEMNNIAKVIAPVASICLSSAALAGEPVEIALWPQENVATQGAVKTETVDDRGKTKSDRFVGNVQSSTLTVYLPDEKRATGTAVIICPGGGYGGLAIDKEGHDVARWLNTLGVAGIVLKYRMPRPDLTAGQKPWPVQDAERAIRLVRSQAPQWKINPQRVGILGFSAGGHLASTVGTHFDSGQKDAANAIERASSRPDFLILIYPVISMREPITHEGSRLNLLGKAPDEERVAYYSNELQVTAQTPPTFLVHAKDDRVNVENSVRFHQALQRAGVPSEIHLYEKGGHGYGLGVNGGEVATWPERCAAWLKARNLLEPAD
jgi:acetyl esterase/lipase